jgi:thiol-disulfide isomerase/thioredoxin
MSPSDPENAARHRSDELTVVCLCAEWCGTCREYRGEFERLGSLFPRVRFFWRDIEDEENAGSMGDLDIEDFPTILAYRREWVLFFGSVRPQAEHLRRLIGTFLEQDAGQDRHYALSHPERKAWQTDSDLAGLIQSLRDHSS